MDAESQPTDLTHLDAERLDWLSDRLTRVAGRLRLMRLGRAHKDTAVAQFTAWVRRRLRRAEGAIGRASDDLIGPTPASEPGDGLLEEMLAVAAGLLVQSARALELAGVARAWSTPAERLQALDLEVRDAAATSAAAAELERAHAEVLDAIASSTHDCGDRPHRQAQRRLAWVTVAVEAARRSGRWAAEGRLAHRLGAAGPGTAAVMPLPLAASVAEAEVDYVEILCHLAGILAM